MSKVAAIARKEICTWLNNVFLKKVYMVFYSPDTADHDRPRSEHYRVSYLIEVYSVFLGLPVREFKVILCYKHLATLRL